MVWVKIDTKNKWFSLLSNEKVLNIDLMFMWLEYCDAHQPSASMHWVKVWALYWIEENSKWKYSKDKRFAQRDFGWNKWMAGNKWHKNIYIKYRRICLIKVCLLLKGIKIHWKALKMFENVWKCLKMFNCLLQWYFLWLSFFIVSLTLT